MAVHLDENLAAVARRVVGTAHSQEERVVVGVRARQVGQDARVLGRGLHHRRPGPVGVNHAVDVVRVGNPSQGLGPNHQCPPGIPRPDEVVGHDHPLQPARASEGQVEGDGVGVLDSQAVLDPRGDGGHGVAPQAAVPHVPEIVRHDDVVQAFPVEPVQGRFRRLERHVGGAHVVGRVAPLLDAGDLVQFLDDLRVGALHALAVGIEKCLAEKLRIRYAVVRDVITGCRNDRVRHAYLRS